MAKQMIVKVPRECMENEEVLGIITKGCEAFLKGVASYIILDNEMDYTIVDVDGDISEVVITVKKD